MSANNKILVPIHGEQVGLDIDHNLLVQGDSLVLKHKTSGRQVLKASNGSLLLNGGVIAGAGAGGGSFDNTVAQLPNNPTTLQAAIVELKALFDSVLS